MAGSPPAPQFPYCSEPIAPFCLLDPNGVLAEGSVSPLNEEQMLSALRLMMLSRAFDHKGISLQRQGRFGTFSPVHGQEGSVVGSAFALDPTRDWVVPQYRSSIKVCRSNILFFTSKVIRLEVQSPMGSGSCPFRSRWQHSCRMRSDLLGACSYKPLTGSC